MAKEAAGDRDMAEMAAEEASMLAKEVIELEEQLKVCKKRLSRITSVGGDVVPSATNVVLEIPINKDYLVGQKCYL